MIGVPGRNGDPGGGGYNGVAGWNGGSVGDGSFCVSDSGSMSKCVDITGVVAGNIYIPRWFLWSWRE